MDKSVINAKVRKTLQAQDDIVKCALKKNSKPTTLQKINQPTINQLLYSKSTSPQQTSPPINRSGDNSDLLNKN